MSAFLFYGPRYKPTNSNGIALPSSKLTFYYSGTTTFAPIYTDSSFVTQLSNPLTADSSGKFAAVYMDSDISYRVILKDKDGITLEDTDPYVAPAGGSGGGGSGGSGIPGANAISLLVTAPAISVPADSSGVVSDFGAAQGYISVFNGSNDVTASSVLAIASSVNVTGTVNTANNTPVAGKNMGFYQITAMSANSGSLTIQATYAGVIYTATVIIAKSIAGSTGAPGSGTSAISIYLSPPSVVLPAFADGTVPDYTIAVGNVHVISGTVDVTSSCTLSATPDANTTGTVNTSTNTPVNGQPKGYYQVTNTNANVGTMTISAVYSGTTLTATFFVTKIPAGYEIVASLPITNLFDGRIVFLSTDLKLYKYVTGTGWVAVVNANDMTGQLSSGQIAAIDAAKITGTLTTTQIGAGTIQTGNLAAAAVQTANLAAGAVTTGTLAAGAVTATKIAAGSITSNELAAGSVTTNQLQAGAVTAATIAANTITSAQLSTGTLITNSAQLGTATISSANIQDLTIGTTKIADFAISSLAFYEFVSPVFGGGVSTASNFGSETWAYVRDDVFGSGLDAQITLTNTLTTSAIVFTISFQGQNPGGNQCIGIRRDDGTFLVGRNYNIVVPGPPTNLPLSYTIVDPSPITGSHTYNLVYMNAGVGGTTSNSYYRLFFSGQVFRK